MIKNLLYITTIGLLVLIGNFVIVATRAVGAIPGELTALRVQVAATSNTLLDRELELQSVLDKQLTGVRSDLASTANRLETIADTHLDRLEPIISAPIAGITADIHRTTTQLDATLAGATGIEKQVADAAPLWLDCEYNPDCAFNRYQGTAKALELMAKNLGATSQQFPQLVATLEETNKNVAGITADAHTLTAQFVAPKTMKQKIFAALKFAIWSAGRVF